jgi:hypothetical protein
MTSNGSEPGERCGLLRSLHRAGDPLVLRNAWDVATAEGLHGAGTRTRERAQDPAESLASGAR